MDPLPPLSESWLLIKLVSEHWNFCKYSCRKNRVPPTIVHGGLMEKHPHILHMSDPIIPEAELQGKEESIFLALQLQEHRKAHWDSDVHTVVCD
jgi:hypothetical protein